MVDAAVAIDAESPMSPNAEATAAYRAGMRALRDATLTPARTQLGHAVELDPLFGAAQLRLALLNLLLHPPIAASDLQGTRDAQASLGVQDHSLLQALEPMTLVPPDPKEAERRLEVAARTYPSNPDFPFTLALVVDGDAQPDAAETAIESALQRDPGSALAWRVKALLRAELDDLPGAYAAFDRCLQASPGGTWCARANA
jgi:tetratricopeptide (TPR) repeat protein